MIVVRKIYLIQTIDEIALCIMLAKKDNIQFINGGGGVAYEDWHYRNAGDFTANCRRCVDVFHEITDFRLRHMV